MEVNVNSAECLKTATNIGYDTVHNICSGAATNVPWGAGDWVGAIFLGSFMGALALLALAFVSHILVTIIRGY